ncbi:MAG: nucleotidyl transferase AbiEii/AbiGii toxin family protein [bacterium]|nr:nucleotidyl transferase AbiEii/AbiGii toxin family protein [bacterium]
MNFDTDEKLKGFLKRESKRLGVSIKNTYNTYFSRILLERISNLCYDELFVKGSFSEIAHLNEMIRPITDIDLVSTKYHNDPLIVLYQAMYDSNSDLYYELTNIPKITKTGIYKINIVANFGKIKHPISIDFQELSRTIYEKDYKRINPIFKGDNHFYVLTPSYEEHLAEKLCIVVENNKSDVLNTRVKDFYDIYKLCGGKYDKDRLLYFFKNMLIDRNKIKMEDVNIDFLDEEYIEKHKNMWYLMSDKYEFLDRGVNFDESVKFTKKILKDQLDNLDKVKNLNIKLR